MLFGIFTIKMKQKCIITVGYDEYPYQEFNAKRYHLYKNEKYYSRGRRRLHIVVYEFFNGKVEKGFHVHHIDEDRSNNHISNLEKLQSKKHQSHHMQKADKDMLRARMAHASSFAPEWHRSPDGIAWHRANSFKFRPITKKCIECGSEFTRNGTSENNNYKFCSTRCKQRNRFKRLGHW
jgi:hypothetical protein